MTSASKFLRSSRRQPLGSLSFSGLFYDFYPFEKRFFLDYRTSLQLSLVTVFHGNISLVSVSVYSEAAVRERVSDKTEKTFRLARVPFGVYREFERAVVAVEPVKVF